MAISIFHGVSRIIIARSSRQYKFGMFIYGENLKKKDQSDNNPIFLLNEKKRRMSWRCCEFWTNELVKKKNKDQ